MRSVLVTVDYLNESMDLGLPAEAPISEFLPILLEMWGLARQEVSPPSDQWELAYGSAALSVTRSLQSYGVVDGMRLTLRMPVQERAAPLPGMGRVQVLPYSPAAAQSEGPRVHWVQEDLLNQ